MSGASQADAPMRGAAGSDTRWDSTLYDESFGIITRLGAGVVELLAPQPGERIIDLGCGTGALTAQIAAAGAEVLGIDASEAMIARARELYPELRFEVAKGENFTVESPVNAVFSNAALHWMSPPEAVAASVARALVPGGRFVAEMGGSGNIATIVAAVYQALAEEGIPEERVRNPWYFPTIGEYASLLEGAGFEVRFVQLFDRPTPLDDCANGIADWLRMFGGDLLAPVPAGRRTRVQERVNDLTRPRLQREERWVADYRRLRFVAVIPESDLPARAPEAPCG
ncbi:MAG TPA: methyltransferase domain-containing protein [Thermomicrobiales bacterium]|nr:methyltransferase domain-containing protein [Thermomicrobiales bacterium]